MADEPVVLPSTLRRSILLAFAGAVVVAIVFLAVIQRLLSESGWLRHSEEVIAAAG